MAVIKHNGNVGQPGRYDCNQGFIDDNTPNATALPIKAQLLAFVSAVGFVIVAIVVLVTWL